MAQETTQTLEIERTIRAPAERIYDAILDRAALAKWNPPGGYTAEVHELDARVGGTYRMSFTSLDKSDHHTFGGTYVALERPRLIRATDAFETEEETMAGEMQVTYTLEEGARAGACAKRGCPP